MKKAFMRSVEASLAILLFFSFYNISSTNFKSQTIDYFSFSELHGVIDSMQLNGLIDEFIESYELNAFSELISYFISPSYGLKIEYSYIEPFYVQNLNSENAYKNISFLKFFPKTVNVESVNVIDLDKNFLPTKIINNYYITELSLIINENIENQTILINNIPIRVAENEKINESGIILFINQKKALIEIDSISYNNEFYDANASIKFYLKNAQKNSIINATLFYPANNTDFIEQYASLIHDKEINFTANSPYKSKASQIIFTANLTGNENKKLNLYYEINTNTKLEYSELESNNSANEIIIYDDKYYYSESIGKTYEAMNSNSIKKIIPLKNKHCIINFKVWTYE